MSRLSSIFFFVLCFVVSILTTGCFSSTQFSNEYVEGTSLTIGLWLPVNGLLYGLQALNYLSGKKYKSSNTNITIKTSHSITNSAFGCELKADNSTDIR